MKYVLLFGGTIEGAERVMADYEESGKWFAKYSRAGKVVGGEELQGPSTATTVSRKDGKVTITDGPFIESKDAIGGIFIIEAASLDEAADIAQSCPCLDLQNGYMEVRVIEVARPDAR